jgi:hypothetical protein
MLWRFSRSWSSICASSWVCISDVGWAVVIGKDDGGEEGGGDDKAIFYEVRNSILSLSDEMRVGRSNDEGRNPTQNSHRNQLPLYHPFYRLSLLSPLDLIKARPYYNHHYY